MNIVNNRKNIIMSIIALLLVVVLAVGIVYSWSEGSVSGYVRNDSKFLTVTTGSTLMMLDDAGNYTDSIELSNCNLQEVSSYDGRNFFIPMEYNTSNKTSEMYFREGIPTDENTKYISCDFTLKAGDKETDVYLGAGTAIQLDETKNTYTREQSKALLNALRLSFTTDKGEVWVFKPSQMPGSTYSYAPVVQLDEVTGAYEYSDTKRSTYPFGDYYYKGDGKDDAGNPVSKSLFTLIGNESQNISLSIWLEGTEVNSKDIANIPLKINIDFTTVTTDLIKYTFIDNCHNSDDAKTNHWVDDTMEIDNNGDGKIDETYETMVYIYDKSSKRYYALDSQGKGSNTWVGYLPNTITDFYFRRYSIDIDEWWNEWEPTMEDIPTIVPDTEEKIPERTFVAISGNPDKTSGENITGCYGYWKDAYDTIRVYIKEHSDSGWGQVYCHAYRYTGNSSTSGWVAHKMTFITNTDSQKKEDLWYCDIKYGSEITGLIFTGESDPSKAEDSNPRYQFYSNQREFFFNGFATWYKTYGNNGQEYTNDDGTKIKDTHWVYTDKDKSLIYPFNKPEN